jgi:hypothetical protein
MVHPAALPEQGTMWMHRLRSRFFSVTEISSRDRHPRRPQDFCEEQVTGALDTNRQITARCHRAS